MTDYPQDEIVYQAARQLLPEMNPEQQRQIEKLLAQAEDGVKTDNRIISLLSDDDDLRTRLRELLRSPESKGVMSFDPLPGQPSSIPASQEWMCPVDGCDQTSPVIQEGEDAPNCPDHDRTAMVRGKAKK